MRRQKNRSAARRGSTSDTMQLQMPSLVVAFVPIESQRQRVHPLVTLFSSSDLEIRHILSELSRWNLALIHLVQFTLSSAFGLERVRLASIVPQKRRE